MKKEELSERLLNPQPFDDVIARYHDGSWRKAKFRSLSPLWVWENTTEFGDSIPTYTAGKEAPREDYPVDWK